MPASGTRSSRSRIACISLCFSCQAVFWLTPSWRASSSDEMPCLDCVTRWMARNQVVSGSRVLAKSVPAVRETWCLQELHWKSLRVRRRQ